MAMVQMPLVIKAKMTYENYRDMIREATEHYSRRFLREYFQYDGKYFSIDICLMDNYEVFNIAKMVARYASPTSNRVGLVFSGKRSYDTEELYFENKECKHINEEDAECDRRIFYKRKEQFLSAFEARDIPYYREIDELLTAKIEYNPYCCVGLSYDVLEAIYKAMGYTVEDIHNDEYFVYIELNDPRKNATDILAEYFGYKSCSVICNQDKGFSYDEVMVLLKEKEDEK